MVSPIQPDNQDFAARIIRQAARDTGVDFNFLVDTAARESNFDTRAQALTSSAAGMFQFIEQTWLGMMSRHGEKHGYGTLASAIKQGNDGRFSVSDPQQRQQILDLRFDAQASAVMAGELARENAQVIEQRIGRQPDSGELYAAHFLGANGAAGLIHATETTPARRADEVFPAAAAANRAIFFENGQPRSVSQVLSVLKSHHSGETSGLAQSVGPNSAVPAGSPFVAHDVTIRPVTVKPGTGELSPALVEILASLKAPETGRVREV